MGRPLGARNKNKGIARPTDRGVGDMYFYKCMRNGRTLRCQEISAGTRQCINPADYDILWHGFDNTMAFCVGHLRQYDYPDSSICECNIRGKHSHYDIVRTLQPSQDARQRVGELQ